MIYLTQQNEGGVGMAYNYNVKLEIANDKKREGFSFMDIEKEIIAAIDKYHTLNTVRHKKSYRIGSLQKFWKSALTHQLN